MASKYATTVTKPVFEVVPPGDYHLRVRDVEDGPIFENKRGEAEPTVKLQLEVAKGPHAGMRLSQLLNLNSWGPKSNATRWAQALTGAELDEGAVFDPMDHIGDVVWARVLVEPDGKGIERNKVDIVMSLARLQAQFTGEGPTGAAPRPAPAPSGTPRVARGLEAPPDRELEIPDDPGWDAMEPPPPDDGEEAR